MSFRLPRASILSAAPLVIACISTEPSTGDNNGSGATAATGAAGTPGAAAGMPGAGGSAGSSLGASGIPAAPAVGGMAATSGGAPGLGGAGTDASGGLSGGGGIAASTGGIAASAGGAPAAGMSGDGAGGAPVAGAGGEITAGVGGAGAGMGGAAGSASGCGDGCAQLSVPFTTWKAGQYFEIYLSGATDLSAAVINVKARKLTGKAGGLLIVVKDGSAQEYAYAQGAWNAINDMTTAFATYTLDVAAPASTDQNHTFTPTAVQIVTIQLAAGDPWYTDEAMMMEDPAALVNPTVIQIDEISITGTGTLPGPWTFTADATAIKATITDEGVNASPPYAITGSTVTWIAP